MEFNLIRLSSRPWGFRQFCLAGIFGLLGTLGCVDGDEGGGGLYLFDNATSTVQVFSNVEELHKAGKDSKPLPEAVRSIKSDAFKGITLAWGGLALDDRNHRLYLVAEDGAVYAIANPKTLKGSISGKDKITSFRLGSISDRLGRGSVFGQASVDPNGNCLYVMETSKDGEESRLWVVRNASKVSSDTIAKGPKTICSVDGDKRGAGVAAGVGNRVYALFGGGKNFEDGHGAIVSGARLREGVDGTFPINTHHKKPINTMVGKNSKIPDATDYGSVAYDGRNHTVYVLVPKSGDAATSILAFGEGQFHGHHDQAPNRTLPDPPKALRLIVHPVNGDWLLGAAFTRSGDNGNGKGLEDLYIWKGPSGGGTVVKVEGLPGVKELRGMAMASD
jgi:hypothetical protein